jgi:single-stranded-DNA-specific exonuclease
MPPTLKRWNIKLPVPPDFRARFPHLHPLLVQILHNRGVIDPDDVDAFLTGRVRVDDPLRLSGMAVAVERIRRAVRESEPVAVYGDFDADGVTSTVLLVQALRALGLRVSPYIPHRVNEGYGLNFGSMDKVAAWGARLVITVDCGVRSLEEVAYAQGLGMDVIVTDHHSIGHSPERGQELPPALAVINPKQAGDRYPFKDLAGVGLAFKLAQAVFQAEREDPLAAAPLSLGEADLLDLVALGTVADVASLLGENRSLVQRGLLEINRARRPGVLAMLDEAKLSPGRVDATAIGFVLGPRLNAAGRLASASIAYRLLTAPDASAARSIAIKLGELNRQRQALTQRFVAVARQRIEQERTQRYLYLIDDAQFEHGVVGLVAGRLAEELYRPSLVARVDGESTRGSARSIPEFDITAALDECRDLLLRHGGHAAAAGFTVANDRLPELRARLEALAEAQLAGRDLRPVLDIDAVIELGELDWATQELLTQLEPCGSANPQPVLASLGLEVTSKSQVGLESQHLKLTVRDPRAFGPGSGQEWEAIAFRHGHWYGRLPPTIDLAYTLECNEFNGARRLQLNVKDIRPAEVS